jgi:citrate lyase beta subunit
MAVLLDENGLVPALEQMACPSVTFVEELGVDSIQLPHTEGEVAIRRLDKDMVMVGHEAVGVADPIIPLVDVLEGVQEVQSILVVLEDGLLLVTAGGNVINSTGVFDAEGTGHG